MWSKWNSRTLTMRTRKSLDTGKQAVPYKVKTHLPCDLKMYSTRNKTYVHLKICSWMFMLSFFIIFCLEITQVSFKILIDEQTLKHSCNGMLFSNKRKHNTKYAIFRFTEWKKPVSKFYMWSKSIYLTSYTAKKQKTKNQIKWLHQVRSQKRGLITKEHEWIFWECGKWSVSLLWH